MSKKKKKDGRPTKFNADLAKEICTRIANGETLTRICRPDDMPSTSSVYSWLYDAENGHKTDPIYQDFLDNYMRAREHQSERFADEIIDISDDGRNDTYMTDEGRERVDHDHIQRSKLRVDARKWHAAKTLPKKYGDKVRQEISGPDNQPLPVVNVTLSGIKSGDTPPETD